MSDEQHAERMTTPAPAPTVVGRDAEQLRPHPSATHWGLARITAEGSERLHFRVSDAGEAIMVESVDTFSPNYVREAFGPGRYRINWRQLPADSRKSFTLGNDELVIVAPRSEGGAPRAPSVQTMTCLACGAALAGRFCAQCGAPAGAHAAPTPAPSPRPIGDFKEGVNFATETLHATSAIAKAEAEERIKRYEIDVKATLERERMAHEKALKEQAAWFERVNAGPKFDPDAIVGKIGALVKEEMSGLEARLEELEQRLEELDDDDDENDDTTPEGQPQTPPATDEGKTWNDRIDLAGKVVDKVGAPIVNAIGDVVERIRKGANGAATNAESSQPT